MADNPAAVNGAAVNGAEVNGAEVNEAEVNGAELSGLAAIVTGGGSGIGQATARLLAIVNTCSVAATAGLPQRALYSATKGAVLALTLAMAADHIAEGIRVNCVNPGTADTPWIGRLLDQADDPVAERAALEARQPIGRLVSPQEVAAAIAYLASPAASSVTGTALAVDGGMSGLRLRPRQ
jgi:NAD(P)-dependent dehydrogenase (short-subunit alcohol dehydrogenase family)